MIIIRYNSFFAIIPFPKTKNIMNKISAGYITPKDNIINLLHYFAQSGLLIVVE